MKVPLLYVIGEIDYEKHRMTTYIREGQLRWKFAVFDCFQVLLFVN